MSRSCWFELTPVSPAEPLKVLQMLIDSGWGIYEEGKVLYLPVGDIDDFKWEHGVLEFKEIIEIVAEKAKRSEIIGISITWKDTKIGGSLHIYPDGSLSFNASISRKTIYGNEAWLDVSWYVEKIVATLEQKGLLLASYKYEEIE